ncbi:MAG: hypothetical protein HOY75_08235 [Streptomyces sp.]|nr:hypothetical protein [Streptomyces sp.]
MSTPTRRATTDASHRRAETLTSGWETRSACYNRPQQWWDGEDDTLTDKARTVCAACPVLAECLGQVMGQEKAVLWTRSGVRGGLTGPERVQLFLDQRDHGSYDAEEARLMALEAMAAGQPVDVDAAQVGMPTLRLAQRLAGEDVPMRKPPSAVQLRGGTAKERAFGRAQDILEWREAGMTVRAIAAELQMGRETVQDVLSAFTDLVKQGQGDDDVDEGDVDPRLLVDFLSDSDSVLPVDVQVSVVAEAVKRGMSYPDIDKSRGLSKGYTAQFVSRQRKRYDREGREFPVRAISPRKLRDEDVLAMRERYARGGITDLELALQYGVPRNVISSALSGRNYKNVGGPIRAGISAEGKDMAREWGAGHRPKSRAAMAQTDLEEAA